jgi:hypothetical protein
MNKDYVYFPTTNGHLILTFLLVEQNKGVRNSIILDEQDFSKEFIKKITEINRWHKVYIIKKVPKIRDYINRNILYKVVFGDVFSLESVNLVTFSFGSEFVNTVVNHLHGKNNICLSEDGVFPYFGLDVVRKHHTYGLKRSRINEVKFFVRRLVNAYGLFNPDKIDSFLIMSAEWLPNEVVESYNIEKIIFSDVIVQSGFDKLTELFQYKARNIAHNTNVIFFDDGSIGKAALDESEQFDLYLNIFNQFPDRSILIKLRPGSGRSVLSFYQRISKKTSARLVFSSEESDYPWEVIYYNNSVKLSDTIFIGSSFSTVFISSLKYFHVEHNVICFREIFTTEKMKNMQIYKDVSAFIEKVKLTCVVKKIETPLYVEEINKISFPFK